MVIRTPIHNYRVPKSRIVYYTMFETCKRLVHKIGFAGSNSKRNLFYLEV